MVHFCATSVMELYQVLGNLVSQDMHRQQPTDNAFTAEPDQNSISRFMDLSWRDFIGPCPTWLNIDQFGRYTTCQGWLFNSSSRLRKRQWLLLVFGVINGQPAERDVMHLPGARSADHRDHPPLGHYRPTAAKCQSVIRLRTVRYILFQATRPLCGAFLNSSDYFFC